MLLHTPRCRARLQRSCAPSIPRYAPIPSVPQALIRSLRRVVCNRSIDEALNIMDYRTTLANGLRGMDLPFDAILVLHVRLKGLIADFGDATSDQHDYRKLSEDLIEVLEDLYRPRGILVPTFTYSFTKTGIYDRMTTPGEVGRFGEEVRAAFPWTARTMNPVFSFIDCHNILTERESLEFTAFGPDSLWARLSDWGHVCVNINVPELFGTYLHYLEAYHGVSYRYTKDFPGRVSPDGKVWKNIKYEYYVRDLDRDTRWRREKIAAFLHEHKVLHDRVYGSTLVRWFHSTAMDEILGAVLEKDAEFLISDKPSPELVRAALVHSEIR